MGNKVDGSLDSLLGSIQGVFRDCSEQKRRAVSELKERKKRFESEVEDFEQMKTFADANNGTMRVINDLIGKKIELVKIHARLINTHGVSSQIVEHATTTSPNDYKDVDLLIDKPLSSRELSELRNLATSSDYDEVLDTEMEIKE